MRHEGANDNIVNVGTGSPAKIICLENNLDISSVLFQQRKPESDMEEDKGETSGQRRTKQENIEDEETKSRCPGSSLLLMPSRRPAGHSPLTSTQ